jgi:triphosphatase
METELKLRFIRPDGQTAFLADTWANGLIMPDSKMENDMLSRYFDTAEQTLTQMKTSLRIRQEGENRVATLKLGGRSKNGLHQRLEWSVRLEGENWPETADSSLDIYWFQKYATSDGDPDDLLWEVLQKIEGQQLIEICQARFRRISFDVGYGDTLMELALDDGELGVDEQTETINELELELKEGDVRDLMALGDELMARFELVPENMSKYARCLALLRQTRQSDA